MEYPQIWMRIAGHAQRIRDGEANRWRIYPNRQTDEIPIADWRVDGRASDRNFIPGTDPSASNPMGLTAWIDIYGDVIIEGGVARITLGEP